MMKWSLLPALLCLASPWAQKLDFIRTVFVDIDTREWQKTSGNIELSAVDGLSLRALPEGELIATFASEESHDSISYSKAAEGFTFYRKQVLENLEAKRVLVEFWQAQDSLLVSVTTFFTGMTNAEGVPGPSSATVRKFDMRRGILKHESPVSRDWSRNFIYSPEGELLQGETVDRKGKRNGLTTLFFPDGTPHLNVLYEKGKAVKLVNCQDIEGNAMECGTLQNGTGYVQSHLDCDCKDKTIFFIKGKHVSEEVFRKKMEETAMPTPSTEQEN